MLPLTTKRPSVPFPPSGPTWGFDCLARRKWTHSCVHTDVGDGAVEYIFSFLHCFLLLFFPQLFVKLPRTTTLPSCTSFFFEMVLVTASWTMLQAFIHSSSGTLSARFNFLNLLVISLLPFNMLYWLYSSPSSPILNK